MTQRTRDAVNSKNPLLGSTALAVAVYLLALGCGSTTPTSTDTRTNWLSSCSDDSPCTGGLSCLCGVCTASCPNDDGCGAFGDEARCVEVPDSCTNAQRVCAREAFTFPAEGDSSTAQTGSSVSGLATGEDAGSSGVTSSALLSSGRMSSEVTSEQQTTSGSSSDTGESSTVTGASSDVTDAGVDPCDVAGRRYTSRNPEECTSLPDCGILAEGLGDVPFNDECGCGCEPYVPPPRRDTLLARECSTAPTSGSAVPATIIAESARNAVACGQTNSMILRSQAEVEAWAVEPGCRTLAEWTRDVDFAAEVVIFWSTPEQPLSMVEYVGQTIDGVFHVGVRAAGGCGPGPAGYVMLRLPAGRQAAVIVSM